MQSVSARPRGISKGSSFLCKKSTKPLYLLAFGAIRWLRTTLADRASPRRRRTPFSCPQAGHFRKPTGPQRKGRGSDTCERTPGNLRYVAAVASDSPATRVAGQPVIRRTIARVDCGLAMGRVAAPRSMPAKSRMHFRPFPRHRAMAHRAAPTLNALSAPGKRPRLRPTNRGCRSRSP
jgi:hypothetical protein